MKRILAIFLTLLITTSLISCNQKGKKEKESEAQKQTSTIDSILKSGKIRVGMSSFVPWAFRDKNGNFVGYEIDVARELAKDLEVELELVPTAWDGIIPALLSGKMDVIIGGMSITTKRNLQMNFTLPYGTSGLQLAANKKKAGNLKTIEDFNSEKVTIVVRRGGSAVEVANKFFPNAEIVEFDDEASLQQEVLNGNATALISSSPLPAHFEFDNPDLIFRPSDGYLSYSEEGFALRRGDLDTMNVFNNWIRIKTNSGWLVQRHKYWFETREWSSLLPE